MKWNSNWKKLPFSKIKIGMIARLVEEKSWANDCWVIGMKEKEFEIVDKQTYVTEKIITVRVNRDDWQYAKNHPDVYTDLWIDCSDNFKHFEYRVE